MKIAVGSDMDLPVVHFVVGYLRDHGHEVVVFGAPVSTPAPWPRVAIGVGKQVAAGIFDQAVLFCWTGTGISLAANKVPGIRAALCTDAETARGARQWNDANILAMSLRLTTNELAREMLEAWFQAGPSTDAGDVACLEFLEEAEKALRGHSPN